jgi:hypothetical protein
MNRNILRSLTQKDTEHMLHPNNASPLSIAPTITSQDLQNNLLALGIKSVVDLPKTFDWRDQEGIILSSIKNQGGCGNCWAMSSTACLADRWMIKTGYTGLDLDPLDTTVCVKEGGCAGGYPEKCQEHFESVGGSVVQDNCTSWEDYCKDTENCCAKCLPSVSPNITCEHLGCEGGFKAVPNGMFSATVKTNEQVDATKTIHSIKTDIKLYGPVVAKFGVYGDFYAGDSGVVVAGGKSFKWDNTNGIYLNGYYDEELSQSFRQLADSTHSGDPVKLKLLAKGLMPHTNSSGQVVGSIASELLKGFHAVEIVGWGSDSDFGEYWIVKNSWGDKWNQDGYFKFGMNTNGIRNATCGMDVPMMTDTGLFGGTVSFKPTGNPEMKWVGMKKNKSSGGDGDGGGDDGGGDGGGGDGGDSKKWLIWILLLSIGIVALFLILFLIISHYNYRNKV